MHRRAVLLGLALAPLWSRSAIAGAPASWRARSLLGPDGKPTSLVEHAAGGRLVVVVMKGHWCPVCLGQLARLAALQGRLDGLRTHVVGLDADSPKANAEAAEEMGIQLPILSDRQHEVLEALGLWRSKAGAPMPGLVVFDECGAERWRVVGRRPGERVEGKLLATLRKIHAAPPRCEGRGNT